MADDDRALMDRLAALEAEVKADADAQQARKQAALAKLRAQRVTSDAERDQLRARQAALVGKTGRAPEPEPPRGRSRARDPEDDSSLEGLSGGLELASKANRVKQELQRAPRKGDKSWKISTIASAVGPVGWLYAGSWREAVPASAAWLLALTVLSKFLPFLLVPAFMISVPLSAIAGLVYAIQYNRTGKRQRLFGGDKAKSDKPKQLR